MTFGLSVCLMSFPAFVALVLSFASLSRDFGLVIGMPSLQSIWAYIKGSALYFLSNVSGTIMSSATNNRCGALDFRSCGSFLLEPWYDCCKCRKRALYASDQRSLPTYD